MEKENLHLLIHEEIFLIKEKQKVSADTNTQAEVQEEQSEEVHDGEETPVVKNEVKEDQHEENHAHDTPEIPAIETDKIEKLPFAVFHESTKPEEVELIHKIISACQLDADAYKIFGNGFDQSVQFEKALVFVSPAKAFYEPIAYKDSYFLCSQPAGVLMQDQNQKLQLWEALKKFLEIQ